MRTFPTIIDLVGGTPIIRLPKLQPPGGARILAKLEYMNPGGSIKDRIGLPMIEAAERDGLLRPGGRSSSRPRATRASAWPRSRRSAATAASS